MLAYIPAPWILWDTFQYFSEVFHSFSINPEKKSHTDAPWRTLSRRCWTAAAERAADREKCPSKSYGYGSIPITIIPFLVGWTSINPAILMWTTGVPGFWHTAILETIPQQIQARVGVWIVSYQNQHRFKVISPDVSSLPMSRSAMPASVNVCKIQWIQLQRSKHGCSPKLNTSWTLRYSSKWSKPVEFTDLLCRWQHVVAASEEAGGRKFRQLWGDDFGLDSNGRWSRPKYMGTCMGQN